MNKKAILLFIISAVSIMAKPTEFYTLLIKKEVAETNLKLQKAKNKMQPIYTDQVYMKNGVVVFDYRVNEDIYLKTMSKNNKDLEVLKNVKEDSTFKEINKTYLKVNTVSKFIRTVCTNNGLRDMVMHDIPVKMNLYWGKEIIAHFQVNKEKCIQFDKNEEIRKNSRIMLPK